MKASGNDVPVKFDAVFCSQLTWRNIPLGQQKFKKGTTNPRSPIPIRFPSVMFWPTAWFLNVFDVFQLTSSCDVAFWILSVPKATCWWSFGNIGQELHSTEGNVINVITVFQWFAARLKVFHYYWKTNNMTQNLGSFGYPLRFVIHFLLIQRGLVLCWIHVPIAEVDVIEHGYEVPGGQQNAPSYWAVDLWPRFLVSCW